MCQNVRVALYYLSMLRWSALIWPLTSSLTQALWEDEGFFYPNGNLNSKKSPMCHQAFRRDPCFKILICWWHDLHVITYMLRLADPPHILIFFSIPPPSGSQMEYPKRQLNRNIQEVKRKKSTYCSVGHFISYSPHSDSSASDDADT